LHRLDLLAERVDAKIVVTAGLPKAAAAGTRMP
jgi:hypothetical protein